MKEKNAKRLWALLLVACMVLTTALPISAAEEFESTNDGVQSEESTPSDEAAPPEIESSGEEELTDEAISTETEEAVVQDEEVVQEEAVTGARATAADYVNPIQGETGNKKGIQGTAFWDYEGHPWDGKDQEFKNNVDQVFLNFNLTPFLTDIDTSKGTNLYTYNGKKYFFNYEKSLQYYEARIKELNKAGKVVTIEFLMSWSNDSRVQKLIYPGGRQEGSSFYAWNTTDAAAREELSAAIDFTIKTLGQRGCFVQNWIVGNEVDAPNEYNHSGTLDKNTNVSIYAGMFDIVYKARQNQSPYSKVFACVTHNWNNTNYQGIPTRQFIDAFAAAENGKDWCLAYHAYPAIWQGNMWDKESGARTPNSVDATIVTGANLNVLTDYIKNKYGSSHRIILSEQGFSSGNAGGEAAQAASIAYLYYAVANNPMIDAVIYNMYTDDKNFADSDPVRHMGLLTYDGKLKAAYNVFKYMNKSNGHSASDLYMKTIVPNSKGIPIKSWSDSIIYNDAVTGNNFSASLVITQATQKIAGYTAASGNAGGSLSYRYEVSGGNAHIGYSTGGWQLIKDWSSDSSFSYTPAYSGDYIVVCKVYNSQTKETIQTSYGVNCRKELKGTCQIPDPYGRGYLIGIESFSNPSNSYLYEMQIYDINRKTWTYSTGKCKTSGKSLWTTWRPQNGCYWTLFLIYDAKGNVVDKSCYSFIASNNVDSFGA